VDAPAEVYVTHSKVDVFLILGKVKVLWSGLWKLWKYTIYLTLQS